MSTSKAMADKALKKAVVDRYTLLRETGSFTSVSKLQHHHFRKIKLKNIAECLDTGPDFFPKRGNDPVLSRSRSTL